MVQYIEARVIEVITTVHLWCKVSLYKYIRYFKANEMGITGELIQSYSVVEDTHCGTQ